jgi:four helix bundle protein
MDKIKNYKQYYDLEERTLKFSKNVRGFVKKISKTIGNIEDGKQLIRSSGSVGANYIEANECISKKDFCLRIKICRKEAKESAYWLQLIDTSNNEALSKECFSFYKEAIELTKIFSAIMHKSE